jgi:hypothetical protein
MELRVKSPPSVNNWSIPIPKFNVYLIIVKFCFQQQLENGSGFDGANVHDVTALVKQFFRELPEPLFTSMYHDTFIRCYQIEDPEVATRAILLLCLLLPSEHLSTLRFIMKLLSRITEYVESNKMDSTNLAVVLAPNIMHVNSKSETMKSCEEKMLQVNNTSTSCFKVI